MAAAARRITAVPPVPVREVHVPIIADSQSQGRRHALAAGQLPAEHIPVVQQLSAVFAAAVRAVLFATMAAAARRIGILAAGVHRQCAVLVRALKAMGAGIAEVVRYLKQDALLGQGALVVGLHAVNLTVNTMQSRAHIHVLIIREHALFQGQRFY